MTPFISGRKRMLKYHSSLTANGLTPRVIGCSGRLCDVGHPVRVGREAGLVVAADPVEELVARLPLGDLDGVVQADQPHALVHQLLDRLEVVVLDHRVAAAAVHEEDERAGAVEDRLVLGPAAGDDHRLDARAPRARHLASSLQPALNSWSPGPWLGRPATRTILAVSAAWAGCGRRRPTRPPGVASSAMASSLSHRRDPREVEVERSIAVMERLGFVRPTGGPRIGSGGCPGSDAFGQISSYDPGLGTAASFIGPHGQRLLGEGVELGVQRLVPGDCLAGVGRHPAHDGRQRALGDLLQLVDRLVRGDALEQVDVLLDVGVDLVLDADAVRVAPVKR